MITNKEAYFLAVKKSQEIFGLEYLKENKEHTCLTISEQGNVCMLFVGIHTSKSRPNLIPNDKGWTVYAEIYVNKENSAILVKDYQTEN